MLHAIVISVALAMQPLPLVAPPREAVTTQAGWQIVPVVSMSRPEVWRNYTGVGSGSGFLP